MSLFYPRSYSSTPGFSSLFRMLDEFEKYSQETLGNPLSNPFGGLTSTMSSSSGMQTIAPKFDLTENDTDYELQGELPGVPPENVVIEFTDPQTLVIHGHTERERTEGDPSLARIGGPEETKKIEGGKGSKEMQSKDKKDNVKEGKEGGEGKSTSKYWLSERSFGEFSRVFNFPSSVDQDHVEAKFNHGLLSVKVPKMAKKGARKIEIK